MSRIAEVDIYFTWIGREETIAPDMFNRNVALFPIAREVSRLDIVLRHSFHFLESRHFVPRVLDTGKRYDVIYAHDLPTSFAASRLAKKMDAKIVYDVHDLYIETINQFFPARAPLWKKMIFRVLVTSMKAVGTIWERRFIRGASLVVTTNLNYARYLSDRYRISHTKVVANYPEYKEVGKSRKLYEVLRVSPGKGLVVYHGMLNRGRSLELIVGSAQYFDDRNILVIIGNGPLEGVLRTLVSERKLSQKVKFLGHVPYEELFSYTSAATLGLMLIEHINLSKKYATANKVTEYMACGVPVLASDSPENRRIIAEAECGFVRDFHSERELGEFINQITREKAELATLGRNGREAVKGKFNWEHQEPLFLHFIEGLLVNS